MVYTVILLGPLYCCLQERRFFGTGIAEVDLPQKDRYSVENYISIPNYFDKYCVSPDERAANRFMVVSIPTLSTSRRGMKIHHDPHNSHG